jgi:hypothetical protein
VPLMVLPDYPRYRELGRQCGAAKGRITADRRPDSHALPRNDQPQNAKT